jgi:anaerobic ribonucleoside-triphosphate reductase
MNNLSLEEKIKRFPVTCYSRVVGWLTPTHNWNPGKQSEWSDRKEYLYERNNI